MSKDLVIATTGGRRVWARLRPRPVPPNLFAIPLGLAGLAGAWRLAAAGSGPAAVLADLLYLLAALVWLALIVIGVLRAAATPGTLIADLKDPTLSPFAALAGIGGMLLALGLQPHAPRAALWLFLASLGATAVLGGLLTGQWIAAGPGADALHPGYFLPTVAGGLVGAQGAAAFGLVGLGWVSFGVGTICWLTLGPLILNRLLTRVSLPPALIPTIAIAIAPPAVAGNAYFTLSGGRIDTVAYMLAGYTLLMALAQARLAPIYRRLAFGPGFWSFTFPYAAAVAYAIRWLAYTRPPGATVLVALALVALTLFIGTIAARSLMALRRGTFLPAPATLSRS